MKRLTFVVDGAVGPAVVLLLRMRPGESGTARITSAPTAASASRWFARSSREQRLMAGNRDGGDRRSPPSSMTVPGTSAGERREASNVTDTAGIDALAAKLKGIVPSMR
jgi:hypothetical protein